MSKGSVPRKRTPAERLKFESEYDRIFRKKQPKKPKAKRRIPPCK